MHYFKRNIGDYAKKAGRLSMLEHGAYTLLLDACYDREQFPTEGEAIDWCWARTDAEIAAVKFVLSKFFTFEDGKYIQTRVREELSDYHAKSVKNAEIAKEREQKRMERTRPVHGSFEKTHEPPPNHKPLTNNQEPLLKEAKSAKPPRFDPVTVPLPNGLSSEKWQEWIEYRRKRKLSNAEPTMLKQVAFLEACIANGHSAGAVIDASITNGWQGLFEPKPTGGQPRVSKMNDMGMEMSAEEFSRSYEDQGFRVARP